ncbi:sugar phosphate isomerase/epimerase family protein [Bythopirellula goksoeyrii]|uniref:Xylose isomerase-like TIM barrel n=1 Tax=Bythopirellula goksoeyrii TaxID=1400387 RepID=A0A5B9Q7K9_9BACT|nr:sugar phosphate isomerase/epimerase family protein [Bythopirellula goksoeyrii]QEG33659.1 Xylose isomerase-like TIM barrel [Bythopirellula goksoeyrii]
MNYSTNRRQFLSTSIAAAGALAAQPVGAIEPINRVPGHQFKLSLAAYSYRDLLTGNPPKLTLSDFIQDCARFGIEAAELTSYYFPESPDAEYLRRLKGECFLQGLDISGTAIRNDFCLPAGEQREADIAHVKRWIEYADMLDAPVIRIFAGKVQPGQSMADAEKLVIDGIEQCCQYAAKYGVFLALENHGGITTKVDDMLRIVHGVESPWFGVNLDTGNFRTADPYGDLAKLAPYTINAQVKVVMHPDGRPGEASDYNRLADILMTTGYRGYVVLEYEEGGDPRQECPKALEELRKAFT